jgi:hypothetical protein
MLRSRLWRLREARRSNFGEVRAPAEVFLSHFFYLRGEPSSEGRRPESESKSLICEQVRPQPSKALPCDQVDRLATPAWRRVGRGTRPTSAEAARSIGPGSAEHVFEGNLRPSRQTCELARCGVSYFLRPLYISK